MSYSAITQPDKYMGAYSSVPLKVFDTDYDNDSFKYLIHICWDEVNITGEIGYIMGNDVYTKLTSSTPHNFSVGDYVFLDDTLNNNLYTGYYIVRRIINTTEFVIDLTIEEPMGSSAYTTSRFIKYRFVPDLEGYAKLDMSNVLKDFVSQNLTGQSVDYQLKYNGEDTRFDYKLVCGSEKRFRLDFEDNLFSGGSLGFYNSSITGLTNIPFQVGDNILVQQDLYGWSYIDNTYVGSYIGFSGSTNVPFRTGTTITVVGQETHPTYNGVTIVNSIPSSKVVESQKLFISNTPVEGGVIYGVPRPEYNGVCVITEIFIDAIYGLVIITDKSFTDASPVIPGYIQFADGRLTTQPNQVTIDDLSVFNAHLNLSEYTLTEFDKYVIQDRNYDLNYISTIMNDNQKYRVEPNTIGFVLLHQGDDSLSQGIGYSFYNSSNTILGNLLFTGLTDDMYCPIGLEQISGMTGGNNFGIPYSSYSQDINSYCMYSADDCGCGCLTGTIKFKSGSGSTYTLNLTPSGVLNGRNYWDWTMSATTGNVDVRLWWVNDGLSDKWYITPQSNTTYTPYYAFDKDYNTDCPGDTLAWSVPIGSPLSGGSSGMLFVSNPSGGITQYSNEICFELNKDCSMYEIYHIMWKDKLGSFISYPFIYVSRDNIESERKNYYRQNGSWENNSFGYKDYERGEKDFYVRSRKSIIVNSGWLYEFERDLMEDLIQSPSVYLQTPDNRLYGGRLEEKKIEVYKERNDDIFSYSFNFIFSNNEYRF
jgi:hypothetical protein